MPRLAAGFDSEVGAGLTGAADCMQSVINLDLSQVPQIPTLRCIRARSPAVQGLRTGMGPEMQTTLETRDDAGRDGPPFRAARAHGAAARDRGRHPLPPGGRHGPRQRHPGALRPRQRHHASARCSTNEAGVSLGTVEHVMAALAGTGVTHALIDIDGPEVPIMDGSARRFVQAILRDRPRASCRATLAGDPGAEAGPRRTRATWWPSSARPTACRSTSRSTSPTPRSASRPSRSRHGERRLRARARRLPHLLPARRRRDDAGATGSRSAARSTTRSSSRATRC